jgi:hypothetical protein
MATLWAVISPPHVRIRTICIDSVTIQLLESVVVDVVVVVAVVVVFEVEGVADNLPVYRFAFAVVLDHVGFVC